jgi:RHS repeat-associated protein
VFAPAQLFFVMKLQNSKLNPGNGLSGAVDVVRPATIIARSCIPIMTYDAEGTRVSKGTITAWSCDPTQNGYTTTSDFILGPSNEQLTETGMGIVNSTPAMVPQHINVWAGGKLLATYDQDGDGVGNNLHYYFDDPLGTRRAQTDSAGVLEQTCFSLPFGDGETCGTTPTEHLFTGKERDTESGNDFFKYRYYASSMGRWLSPDPAGMMASLAVFRRCRCSKSGTPRRNR